MTVGNPQVFLHNLVIDDGVGDDNYMLEGFKLEVVPWFF